VNNSGRSARTPSSTGDLSMVDDGTGPGIYASQGSRPPSRPEATEVVSQNFGAIGDTSRWTVYWVARTGDVYAHRHLRRPVGDSNQDDRLLGRVPTVDYLHDTVRAISRSRNSSDWEQKSGIDELARWLRRVMAALNAEALTLPFADNEDVALYYIDYGHTRDTVEGSTSNLSARELWDDLDDTTADARTLLDDLTDTLNGDGNLARAATAAQSLVELAIAMHIALHDAYQVAHQQLPGLQLPGPQLA
jgi:hypothetical protein